MTLVIPGTIADELAQHAQMTWPEECCGILTGRRIAGTLLVDEAARTANISRDDRTKTYRIDWEALLAACLRARSSPLEVVGFYHSHPRGTVQPSRRDVEYMWSGYAYVILPTCMEARPELHAWEKPRPTGTPHGMPVQITQPCP